MAEESPLARRLTRAADLDLRRAIRRAASWSSVGDGVARVAGLEDVGYEELVTSTRARSASPLSCAPKTPASSLSGAERVRAGEGVVGTGDLPALPMGPPLSAACSIRSGDRSTIGRAPAAEHAAVPPAPSSSSERPWTRPLLTGVLVIDAAIPIGRGQRELIIGDRNVGKTALAVDIVRRAAAGDVACVYVVIGQPISRVLALREMLLQAGALGNTAIVAADASMPPGLRYLAPYAGATVAEWFRDQGGHALVVYDDLTKHADAYRELSLLLDRPPGREAFPGDVFYIHAELLERATARERAAVAARSRPSRSSRRRTATSPRTSRPMSSRSRTDRSISTRRASSATSGPPSTSGAACRGSAAPRSLRPCARPRATCASSMSRFEELESFTRVGLELEAGAEREIARGRLLRELLRQERLSPRGIAEQVIAVCAVSEGWLDGSEPARAWMLVEALAVRARAELPAAIARLDAGEPPDAGWLDALGRLCRELRAARTDVGP